MRFVFCVLINSVLFNLLRVWILNWFELIGGGGGGGLVCVSLVRLS